MVQPKNPYEHSNGNTLRQLAIMLGGLGSFVFCLIGIWIGIGNEHGDWTPGFDRLFFAMLIAALPCALPFTLNLFAILLLWQKRNRRFGIGLLASSCLISLGIGVVSVQIGNF